MDVCFYTFSINIKKGGRGGYVYTALFLTLKDCSVDLNLQFVTYLICTRIIPMLFRACGQTLWLTYRAPVLA